jgi:protease PrsW
MLPYILLILAFAPVVIIGLYIYSKDKYDREPPAALAWAFILGCLSIVPAVFLSVGLSKIFPESPDILRMALHAFIAVALAEEIVKFFFAYRFFYHKSYFNEPFDGITYCVMVALGFAAVENLLYIFQDSDIRVAVLRMFTAVPGHAVYGVIMGYFMGIAKYRTHGRFKMLVVGILLATLIHGFYDFFLFQQNYPALAILAFVGLAFALRWSFRAIRRQQVFSMNHIAERDRVMEEDKQSSEAGNPYADEPA